MPAFFTHYLFGRLNYEKIAPGVVKNSISRQKKVFALGLAGPDIFFYFMPNLMAGKHKMGSVMHEERCGRFLRNLVRETKKRKGEEQEIAMAYLAGFLGHYELDTHCHPYIYAYIDKEAERINAGEVGRKKPVSNHHKTGIHFQYEAAMDYYFLQHYIKKEPEELNQNKLTRLTRQQRKVVAEVLAAAYNRTYAGADVSPAYMRQVLTSVKVVMRLIRDKHGRKEKLLYPLEKCMYGHSFASGLLVNNNCYGVGKEEFCNLQPLFEKGRAEYDRVLQRLEEVFSMPEEEAESERRRAQKALFAQIGSRSYHTGEETERRKKQ